MKTLMNWLSIQHNLKDVYQEPVEDFIETINCPKMIFTDFQLFFVMPEVLSRASMLLTMDSRLRGNDN